MSYSVVWFKRDLRLQDHAALAHAAKQGPVLCLYIVEPELWRQPDVTLQHFEFVRESLKDLHDELLTQGGSLQVRVGPATEVLAAVYGEAPFEALVSHEETGNAFTYQRDLDVAAWCRSIDLPWIEHRQFGVVRRLKSRNTWKTRWESHMSEAQEVLPALRFFYPSNSCGPEAMEPPPSLKHNPAHRQRGGRRLALATLGSFLNARALGYRGGISSPLTSPDACSRLSTYLTWGCISKREVVQSTRNTLASLPPQASRHRSGLTGFTSRLYWHCHFIQKLESEPAIEWRNMHQGYDGLREEAWSEAHFAALIAARTGWPMVDACVVMLRETGWLNFRMRAMLVSVAAYPLWLDWRRVGQWLATQFLDYEPGIHWSQMQMQSGTTGINTTRVYNPIKQAQDHDPHGIFVRRWLPYMRLVPDTWLFEPWRMPPEMQRHCGLTVGTGLDADIPMPLVDLQEATRTAKAVLHARRAELGVKAGKKAIVEKHASRRISGMKNKDTARNSGGKKSKPDAPVAQLGFDF